MWRDLKMNGQLGIKNRHQDKDSGIRPCNKCNKSSRSEFRQLGILWMNSYRMIIATFSFGN